MWTAGGSGFAWGDVGELTGLTTDESVLLPAVVDSTTNAVENLTLKRRGGNISSPQSREDLTGLLTDGNTETFWRVTRERRPDGTSMLIDLGRDSADQSHSLSGQPGHLPPRYELFVHDGNPAQLREDRPIAFINQVSANLEQSEPDIDAHIPLQFVRFIRLISRSGQEFIIEEAEVFGDGFAPTGSYLAEVIDLGEAANFGQLRLQTRFDPLTTWYCRPARAQCPTPKFTIAKPRSLRARTGRKMAILPIGSPEAAAE